MFLMAHFNLVSGIKRGYINVILTRIGWPKVTVHISVRTTFGFLNTS